MPTNQNPPGWDPGYAPGTPQNPLPYRAPVNTPQFEDTGTLTPTTTGPAVTMPVLPNQDFSGNVKQVQDALFQKQQLMLDPLMERRRSREINRLSQMGLPIGSEAYKSAMSDVNTAEDLAYRNAMLDAIIGGGAEQSRLAGLGDLGFGQQLQLGQFQTGLRNTRINELLSALGMPPQGTSYGMDVSGPYGQQYQGELGKYQAGVGAAQGNRSAASNLLSAIIMAYASSSRDYKDKTDDVDIDELLNIVDSLPLDQWKYRPGYGDGQEHIGTYAEDFKELTGLGNGREIALLDLIGVQMGAIKALSKRVQALEKKKPGRPRKAEVINVRKSA